MPSVIDTNSYIDYTVGLAIGCVPLERVATKLALLEALYTRSILLNGIHYSNAKSRD